jgi:hypothetical protein
VVTAPVTSEVLAVYEAAALHIDRFGIWRLEGLDSPDSILLPLGSFFRLAGLLQPSLRLLGSYADCAMTSPLRLRPQSLSDDDGLTSAGLRSSSKTTSYLDIYKDMYFSPVMMLFYHAGL